MHVEPVQVAANVGPNVPNLAAVIRSSQSDETSTDEEMPTLIPWTSKRPASQVPKMCMKWSLFLYLQADRQWPSSCVVGLQVFLQV